jgi:CHRD domain
MSSRRLIALAAVLCLAALSPSAAAAKGHHARSATALFGVLNGANEIGTDGMPGAGDPDGRAFAAATLRGTKLCYVLAQTGLDTPILAHIHRGAAGVNGPVVIPLTPPSAGPFGFSSDCVPVDPMLAGELRAHPRGFYWNIHTTAFQAGAVRGQVFALGR